MGFRFRDTHNGYLKVTCTGCVALVINGVACHESGCPDSKPGDLSTCEGDA